MGEVGADFRRDAQRLQSVGSSWLLEGTLVGLQALSQDGLTSPGQSAAAQLAVQTTIRQAQDILSRAFNDRRASSSSRPTYALFCGWQLAVCLCQDHCLLAPPMENVQWKMGSECCCT